MEVETSKTLPNNINLLKNELLNRIEQSFKHNNRSRYILGIVGYPGAGKSTVSQALVKLINENNESEPAVVIGMDGFHLSNERLLKLGLLPLKGIPETFDAQGFLELLKRLRTELNNTVPCPVFDRSIEASIEGALKILPKHTLLVIEGNYLLLQTSPWNEAKQYFDEIWFVDTPFEVIYPRLVERHISGGKTKEEAIKKVESTDMPNARLIKDTLPFSDVIITYSENHLLDI